MNKIKVRANGTPGEQDVIFPAMYTVFVGALTILIAAGLIASITLHLRVAVMSTKLDGMNTHCEAKNLILVEHGKAIHRCETCLAVLKEQMRESLER